MITKSPLHANWLWRALAASLLATGFLKGCSELLLSPRQQVVRDAQKAVCDKRDIMAMAPFVSEKSAPALKLMGSMAELGKVIGANPADRLAMECQTSKGLDFLEEVKVTDTRYIVRTKSKANGEVTEHVVVQESGQWKIQLAGK